MYIINASSSDKRFARSSLEPRVYFFVNFLARPKTYARFPLPHSHKHISSLEKKKNKALHHHSPICRLLFCSRRGDRPVSQKSDRRSGNVRRYLAKGSQCHEQQSKGISSLNIAQNFCNQLRCFLRTELAGEIRS